MPFFAVLLVDVQRTFRLLSKSIQLDRTNQLSGWMVFSLATHAF